MELWLGGGTTDRTVILFIIYLTITLSLQSLIKINFPYRLAKLRESGVQFRIRQHFLPSKQPDTEPSAIVVSLVTVAPILVLLVAGNVIGLLILVIEQFVHGDLFKIWPLRKSDENKIKNKNGLDTVKGFYSYISCNTHSDIFGLR